MIEHHIASWENEGGNHLATESEHLEEQNKHYHDIVERARHHYDPRHANPHGRDKYENRNDRRSENQNLRDITERQDW